MNVLHLTHSFLPVTENWIFNQIVFNTRCKSSVLCQYRENEAQFPFDPVFPRYAGKSRYAEFGAKLALKRGRCSIKHARRIIDRVKPDLVHGHFAYVSCCHLETLKNYSLPLVTTCYGLDISKLPKLALWRKRYADLFAYGAAFIVEGPHMADTLATIGCPADKIHCIPIGVDLETVRGKGIVRPLAPEGGTGPLHSNYQLPLRGSGGVEKHGTADSGCPTRILFTGLGREKKGPLWAALAFREVAKKHPDLHLDLIGTGKYLGLVRFTLEKAGLADQCTFHGPVSFKRYLEILRSSDIVLAPSVTAADGDTEGGAPVTVIEAQVAGIPVVGTLHCDIPFAVKNGETGLLCAEKDITGLASNLEKLVVDVDLRKKMGRAAAMRGEEQHDIKKQVEKIYEVYKKYSR